LSDDFQRSLIFLFKQNNGSLKPLISVRPWHNFRQKCKREQAGLKTKSC